MAKQKTKRASWDTTCTEVHPGTWEWQTQGFTWRWHAGFGPNTYQVVGDRILPIAFSKSLDAAVAFTWGFCLGFNAGGEVSNGTTTHTAFMD